MKLKYHDYKSAWCVTALAVLTVAALDARADYQSTVLSQGPVGYWRLNETTQPQQIVAVNAGSLGTAGNGNLTNGVVRGVAGKVGAAYSFSNPSWTVTYFGSAVDVPYNAALNPSGAFTVELWAKPSSQAPDLFSPLASLDATQNSGNSREGYLIYYDGATSKWNFRMGAFSGYAGTIEGGVVTPGAWHHVVGVYNGSTIMSLYVNGVLVNSATITAGAFTPNATQPFRIGATTIPNRTFDGSIDEVAFYGSALSANTIAAHYAAATTNTAGYAAQILTSSPVGYWRLDEPTDPVASNLGSLGSAANGQYFYDARVNVSGPSSSTYAGFEAANKSVAFDAGGGYVQVPALNLNTNALTITAWVSLTNSQTTAAPLVLCRGATTLAGLIIDPTSGGYGLGYAWDNDPQINTWSASVAGLPPLPDSDWAFVALVVQPSQAAIYSSPNTTYSSFTGVTNVPPTGHGKLSFSDPTLFGFNSASGAALNGALDEVAIFNRALSVGEVYSQYAAGVGGVPPRVFSDPQLPNPMYTGDTLALTVDAGGTPNLTYQWRKGGVNISGATRSSYTKTAITAADNGNYDCFVTNASGTATSAAATLSVGTPSSPTIITGPVGRKLYPGATLTLSVAASGGGLHYQWSRNGSPISGATASVYSVPSVGFANGGSYQVAVTSSAGSVTAGPVTITVLSPAPGYESAIVADAPLAWWRLNETSGTNMWDSMGRYDGTYTNVSGSPVTLGAPGAINGSSDTAVTFDGSSDSFGIVPFAHALNSASFSVECWVKATDTAARRGALGSRTTDPRGYWLWTAPSGVGWSGGVGVSGSQYYVSTYNTALSNVVAGVWTHLVLTYNPASNPTYPIQFYVNGQWDGYSWGDFDRNYQWPFMIGGLGEAGTPDAPDAAEHWYGQVDEVVFYDHAITLAQANKHYYLASQAAPTLRTIRTTTNAVVMAWSTNYTGFGLQQVSPLGATNWSSVTNSVTTVGTEYRVTVPTAQTNRFFRLLHP